MKLVVFTICKNEAATIGELLDRIPKNIKNVDTIEILVISDGSTDNTAQIAREKKATKVVEGIDQKRLAYRFQQAVSIVLGMGADIAVNIDGDLQFAPEDIPTLIEPIINENYDFVAADRFTDPETHKQLRPTNMSKGKYWANRLGATVVGRLSGQQFRDVTCGFRAYNVRALIALNINSSYTYTQESFQVLALKKMSITSVPVEVKYYHGRQSRVVKSFWQFLFGSTLNILRAYRDYAPLRFFGTLSALTFIPGIILGGLVAIRWATQGTISPYIAVGILGLFLTGIGIVFALMGLVADMLDRMLNNQEKILEEAKRLRYGIKEQ